MSEPVKKIEKAPESYSPKTKPEILRLTEETAGKSVLTKAYGVKTANGGSYIDGIPMLKWGEWRDNTYCGCVSALLNAAGVVVSYEEVMGLSGVCWQAVMRDDWDPSAQMPQNGLLCEKNVGDAFGIDVYTQKDDKEVWERAKKSVDSGFPVLLVAGRCEPEWTLACGYAQENGRDIFYGRTYFDCQNDKSSQKIIENQPLCVPENEIFTENRYFCFNGFPGWFPGVLTRFYDKKCEPVSPRQALKVSLETCVKMFEQKPGEHHKYGYDAYDILISGFELGDDQYRAKCKNDQYHIGSMQDARRAAYVYLNRATGLLEGEEREKLSQTAAIYKKMLDNLLAAVPYEKTAAVFNVNSEPVWSAKQRRNLAAALKENKTLEKQARVIIAKVLDSVAW